MNKLYLIILLLFPIILKGQDWTVNAVMDVDIRRPIQLPKDSLQIEKESTILLEYLSTYTDSIQKGRNYSSFVYTPAHFNEQIKRYLKQILHQMSLIPKPPGFAERRWINGNREEFMRPRIEKILKQDTSLTYKYVMDSIKQHWIKEATPPHYEERIPLRYNTSMILLTGISQDSSFIPILQEMKKKYDYKKNDLVIDLALARLGDSLAYNNLNKGLISYCERFLHEPSGEKMFSIADCPWQFWNINFEYIASNRAMSDWIDKLLIGATNYQEPDDRRIHNPCQSCNNEDKKYIGHIYYEEKIAHVAIWILERLRNSALKKKFVQNILEIEDENLDLDFLMLLIPDESSLVEKDYIFCCKTKKYFEDLRTFILDNREQLLQEMDWESKYGYPLNFLR